MGFRWILLDKDAIVLRGNPKELNPKDQWINSILKFEMIVYRENQMDRTSMSRLLEQISQTSVEN
jgi:hypothetical protein